MHTRAGVRLTVLAVATAIVAGLALVLWGSMSGPVRVTTHARPPGVHTPSPSPQPSPTAAPTTQRQRPTPATGPNLHWVGESLAVVFGIGLCVLALRLLRLLLDAAPRRLPRPEEGDFDVPPPGVDDAAVRAGLTDQHAAQLAALADLPARNGIVQAWVLFEQAAAHAGAGRRPTETSAEFVVRLLHLLDVDPGPVGRLRGLYVEARFSAHPLGDRHRDEAAAALDAIHRELGALGPAVSR
ncbi:DUF4129 domain-containing protein [Nocardioides terrisoli]|uniref:DUF4129 domain-containing protein n=1 Tax=Nocardioides terrisoli TaxID=3388267 RepID=UPI00287BC998|nr:DUF4129 domain-containing protein [Nocardioides marmorisolisilvae]